MFSFFLWPWSRLKKILKTLIFIPIQITLGVEGIGRP